MNIHYILHWNLFSNFTDIELIKTCENFLKVNMRENILHLIRSNRDFINKERQYQLQVFLINHILKLGV